MESGTIMSRLKELIDEKGVTPYEISKFTGVSQATLSRVLNGGTTKLNIRNLTELAKYFHVSYDWLSTGRGEKKVQNYEISLPRTKKASDVKAAYSTGDPLIESNHRLAKAMESIAESNRILAENNKRLTESNEKIVSEVLRVLELERDK